MRKKVKYKAEVMSIDIETSPSYLGPAYKTAFKVGEVLKVVHLILDEHIFFCGKIEKYPGTIFSSLSDSRHLNGGTWKLIPYYEEEGKMRKKVKYKAEVMSVDIETSPSYLGPAYKTTRVKVGDVIDVDSVFLDSPITIKIIDPLDTLATFTQLTDSYFLNGGAWKLIPYYEGD